MKEAYCSYETSELLKKKGFDTFLPFGFNSTWHTPKPRKFIEDDGRGGFYDDKENWISCPTHQMAMAWLREEKNIHIDFYYLPIHKKYMWSIVETKDSKGTGSKELYEDTVEAALKYALENLI